MNQNTLASESTSQAALERLTATINAAWMKRYNGDAVTNIASLENRINQLAADRDCWLANAHANQKEYLRLDALLRKNKEDEPLTVMDFFKDIFRGWSMKRPLL